MKSHIALVLLLSFVFTAGLCAQDLPDFATIKAVGSETKGKRPVIIIPGIMGSELVNKYSGERVWFNYKRSKDDDLRLPIASTIARNRDNLVPGDILRKIKLLFSNKDFYGNFIGLITKYGGYKEASMSDPPKSLRDRFFVFPYDWRRDNVETAQLLIRRLAALKKATGEKNIKFDIVAHSMGGLVARYAAMYGTQDLSANRPRPTWAGASHIKRIHMFGTPNHGAADSFRVLLEGYGAVKGVNLPFVMDLSALEVFTMPALFQLLPHTDTVLFYDEELKPLKIDIYDFRLWEKYRWSIYGNTDVLDQYSEGQLARLEIYLEAVLRRARRFQRALDIPARGPVKIVSFGSDCEDTLDGYVLLKNNGSQSWRTLTRPAPYTTSKGERIDVTSVREVMVKPGDGRVARRSVLSGIPKDAKSYFACEGHDSLLANSILQRRLLSDLLGTSAKAK